MCVNLFKMCDKLFFQDVTTAPPSQTNGSRNSKMYVPSTAAEDYDVPKKFTVRTGFSINTCIPYKSI